MFVQMKGGGGGGGGVVVCLFMETEYQRVREVADKKRVGKA